MMMGGNMSRMMQMTQERRTATAGQPFRHIKGQLAYFRTELRITDAQASQWSAFADAVRAGAERLPETVAGGPGPLAAPQQLERRSPPSSGRCVLSPRRQGHSTPRSRRSSGAPLTS